MSAVLNEKPPIVTIAPLYLNRKHAAEFLSLSESAFAELVAKGEIPKQRQLSAGRVAWLVDDLVAWGTSRPKSETLPPEGCGHGRRGKPANDAKQA